MASTVDIRPEVLTWAVNRAGLDVQSMEIEYPRFKDWMSQTKKPTFRQLQDFASKVKVPFGYLFLEELPVETIPIPHFKTGVGSVDELSLNVVDTIKTLQRRQSWLVDYKKDEGQSPLSFVGSCSDIKDVASIVSRMQSDLGLSLDWKSKQTNWKVLFKTLVQQAESIGIYVNINSIVDNNSHRSIPLSECRGFVLVDEYAPFIFINNADAKETQLFTLLHELAHIWIGQSAGFDLAELLPADDPVELLCEEVAGQFLASDEEVETQRNNLNNLKLVAKKLKISEPLLARRLFDEKIWDKAKYSSSYNRFFDRYLEVKNSKESTGGDPFSNYKMRIGIPFMTEVYSALRNGDILHRDAYRLTSLKGDTFEKFIKKYIA